MSTLLQVYGGMIALTAIFLIQEVRPRTEKEWLAMVGLSVLWPLCFAIALRELFRR